ncbi:MAG: DUF3795 domain-containing protein [Clostridia bacterium]|nr:DUF3795 domain-containing protein [Clostridia bacterium]
MANYSVCGLDCSACEAKQLKQCLGCREMKGKIFWGECDLYQCNSQKKQEHCGKCLQFPCNMLKEMSAAENDDRIDILKKL